MSDPRRLLDALFERPDRTEWTDAEAAEKLADALCAVLDLHPIGNPGVAAVAWCGGCGNVDTAPDWPCPTVQAITAALEAK